MTSKQVKTNMEEEEDEEEGAGMVWTVGQLRTNEE